jgi:hypothetical protein
MKKRYLLIWLSVLVHSFISVSSDFTFKKPKHKPQFTSTPKTSNVAKFKDIRTYLQDLFRSNSHNASDNKRKFSDISDKHKDETTCRKQKESHIFKTYIYFAEKDIINSLKNIISKEEEQITGAMYMIADEDIASKIAFNKYSFGTETSLATTIKDPHHYQRNNYINQSKNRCIEKLKKAGVNCFDVFAERNKEGLMHQKFLIFKKNVGFKTFLWISSYNMKKNDKNASFYSKDTSCYKHIYNNALITDDTELIALFTKEFDKLKRGYQETEDSLQTQDKKRSPYQSVSPLKKAYFSRDIKPIVEYIIDNEKNHISMAMNIFTSHDIAKHIHRRADKGTHADILTHYQNNLIFKRALTNICSHRNIIVKEMDKSNLLHHKFILCRRNKDNKPLLMTGSCNMTKAGLNDNIEYMCIFTEKDIIDKFMKQFNILFDDTTNKTLRKGLRDTSSDKKLSDNTFHKEIINKKMREKLIVTNTA